jgi:hypothetical protein
LVNVASPPAPGARPVAASAAEKRSPDVPEAKTAEPIATTATAAAAAPIRTNALGAGGRRL